MKKTIRKKDIDYKNVHNFSIIYCIKIALHFIGQSDCTFVFVSHYCVHVIHQ